MSYLLSPMVSPLASFLGWNFRPFEQSRMWEGSKWLSDLSLCEAFCCVDMISLERIYGVLTEAAVGLFTVESLST